MKIALVGSSGGHLTHLLLMKPWWEKHDRFWVTFDKPDARSALIGERTFWCHHPTNRNLPNLLRNTGLAWRVLQAERPDVIISTGAAVAVPFFALGRLLGALTVYVEVYDRIDSPTLTGRLVYPIAHRFVVQWPEQQRFYPKAELFGELL
ncbi:MAG: PssD/Cps14F family polysaccharide biosynthesis glycosyltransferase [Trueperaceae bacterium]|nr:PssD/Cps14F family polysaccharide biosynthesis glycosyltransferase [Trueperaceae bacterium]